MYYTVWRYGTTYQHGVANLARNNIGAASFKGEQYFVKEL
jgi:hypothetical protein